MMHAMRILAVLFLISTAAVAQEKPSVEIGTSMGVVFETNIISTLTIVGIPGQGILSQPALYASFFATERMFVQPQFGLERISRDNASSTVFGFGLRAGYLFDGASTGSPYVAADWAVLTTSANMGGYHHSDSEMGFGGAFGYRFVVGGSLGLRIEGSYRRWFDNEVNEIGIGIGIGGVLRRAG